MCENVSGYSNSSEGNYYVEGVEHIAYINLHNYVRYPLAWHNSEARLPGSTTSDRGRSRAVGRAGASALGFGARRGAGLAPVCEEGAQAGGGGSRRRHVGPAEHGLPRRNHQRAREHARTHAHAQSRTVVSISGGLPGVASVTIHLHQPFDGKVREESLRAGVRLVYHALAPGVLALRHPRPARVCTRRGVVGG